MISSISIRSDVAVYMQIENHIKFAIASGKLKPGDQLPAMRDIATALGVNLNTVVSHSLKIYTQWDDCDVN